MKIKFSKVADQKPETLLKNNFFPWNFFKDFTRKFHLATFRKIIFKNTLSPKQLQWQLRFFKNTFFPEHLHWLSPVFSNKNYFVESIFLVCNTSIISFKQKLGLTEIRLVSKFLSINFQYSNANINFLIFCFIKTCFIIVVEVI